MSIPSNKQLETIFSNEEEALNYLISNDVFYETFNCESCGGEMKRYIARNVFQCNSQKCRGKQLSMKKGTFFFGSNLKCINILKLSHLWLSKVSIGSAIILTGHSSKTVRAFYSHFRNLVMQSIDIEDVLIGGENIIVEVDETKLGKRKYNRGHRVDGVWVIVGIERTEEKKVFVVPVENRDSETIDKILSTHIKSGSIIYTDRWKGYQNLNLKFGFDHKTVNHSENFKDKETGICTNTVEGINNGIKMGIKARNRVKDGIEGHLFEYIWRRKNKECLWSAFIKALKEIHYF